LHRELETRADRGAVFILAREVELARRGDEVAVTSRPLPPTTNCSNTCLTASRRVSSRLRSDRSSARIEPDTSTASTIAMPSRRTRAFLSPARGPARPITSAMTARPSNASGSHAIRVRHV
jgi:hypothetical protein